MKLLLSIHTEHADNIYKGIKTIEYRKTLIKCLNMTVLFYETSPKKKITGEAKISEILIIPKNLVWQKTHERSSAKRQDLINYYKDKEIAFCYCLTDIKKYKISLKLEDLYIKNAPQSYCFIKES